MGFILDKIFNSWINGAIEFFLKIIAEIAGVSVYVLELDIVKQAIIYTQVIALSPGCSCCCIPSYIHLYT